MSMRACSFSSGREDAQILIKVGHLFLCTGRSGRPINFPSKGQKVVALTNGGEVVGRESQ